MIARVGVPGDQHFKEAGEKSELGLVREGIGSSARRLGISQEVPEFNNVIYPI